MGVGQFMRSKSRSKRLAKARKKKKKHQINNWMNWAGHKGTAQGKFKLWMVFILYKTTKQIEHTHSHIHLFYVYIMQIYMAVYWKWKTAHPTKKWNCECYGVNDKKKLNLNWSMKAIVLNSNYKRLQVEISA